MKKALIAALAIVGLCLLPISLSAAEGSISSTVHIANPVVVQGNGSLSFGYLSAPTNGVCDFWTIDPQTGTMTHDGGGNGVDFIADDHSEGDFIIIGGYIDGEMVNYTVDLTNDFADPYLTLHDISAYPSGPFELNNPKMIMIGGTLEVCPGAEALLHTDAVITLTANYELATISPLSVK